MHTKSTKTQTSAFKALEAFVRKKPQRQFLSLFIFV